MDEAQSILGSTANITKVQNTYLRKKVMTEAENETTIDAPATEYSEQITLVAEFLLHLLSEREKLSVAIFQAKAGLTGYAQVYGSYTTSPKDKLLMDLMYIEGWSFLLDINLFLLTVRTLFMTEKTQGRQAKHDAVNRQDSIEVQS